MKSKKDKNLIKKLKEKPISIDQISTKTGYSREEIYNSYVVEECLLYHTSKVDKDNNLKWTHASSNMNKKPLPEKSYKSWLKNMEENYFDVYKIIKNNSGIKRNQIKVILKNVKNKNLNEIDIGEILDQLNSDEIIFIGGSDIEETSINYNKEEERVLRNTINKDLPNLKVKNKLQTSKT